MKTIKRLIPIMFLAPSLLIAQSDIELHITYGTYINDHVNREFISQERIWTLSNGELIYLVDAHGRAYADTIKLDSSQILSISEFVKDHNLNRSIAKDLSTELFEKHGWNEIIKGGAMLNKQEHLYNLRGNAPSCFEKDTAAHSLEKLEQMLYKIVE